MHGEPWNTHRDLPRRGGSSLVIANLRGPGKTPGPLRSRPFAPPASSKRQRHGRVARRPTPPTGFANAKARGDRLGPARVSDPRPEPVHAALRGTDLKEDGGRRAQPDRTTISHSAQARSATRAGRSFVEEESCEHRLGETGPSRSVGWTTTRARLCRSEEHLTSTVVTRPEAPVRTDASFPILHRHIRNNVLIFLSSSTVENLATSARWSASRCWGVHWVCTGEGRNTPFLALAIFLRTVQPLISGLRRAQVATPTTLPALTKPGGRGTRTAPSSPAPRRSPHKCCLTCSHQKHERFDGRGRSRAGSSWFGRRSSRRRVSRRPSPRPGAWLPRRSPSAGSLRLVPPAKWTSDLTQEPRARAPRRR